jgi:hypothetical protein
MGEHNKVSTGRINQDLKKNTEELGVTKEQHQGNILGFSYIAPPFHPLSSL